MNRESYLSLITETFFETRNPVASEINEPLFELRKKLFRQIIIRKQKVAEREEFVTKEEFELQCALAIDEIKEYVSLQSFFEINELHKQKDSFNKYWFDENGRIQDIPDSVIENNISIFQKRIDDFDEDNFLVELSGLNPVIHRKISNNEVMFIEDVFECFNLEEKIETDKSAINDENQNAIKLHSILENRPINYKNPFNQKILFSFKEYKELFESQFSNHLKIHQDYDLKHFLLHERSIYKTCYKLVDSIGCIPADLINDTKNIILNINGFDYGNIYIEKELMEDFFIIYEENEQGNVVIEERLFFVMDIINLFKGISFEEYIIKTHNLKHSLSLIIDFLKGIKKRKGLKEEENEIINSKEKSYLGTPTNEKANDFFEFLIENYRASDKTIVKYVNILYYLKNHADKKHFIFKLKQSEYKILIKEKIGININKFEKSAKYEDEEKQIFHSLENTFLKNTKV